MVQNVNKSFHQDIEEGLIEVILVNETFYPSVNITLQITFTESQGSQKVLICTYSWFIWEPGNHILGAVRKFSKMPIFAKLEFLHQVLKLAK